MMGIEYGERERDNERFDHGTGCMFLPREAGKDVVSQLQKRETCVIKLPAQVLDLDLLGSVGST